MNRVDFSRMVAVFVLSLLLIASRGGAQTELEGLFARLSERPLDRRVIWKLEGHPADARIIPALREAFEKREAQEEKQWIAVALLRLGERSDRYYQFLAGFATEAIDDRTPLFVKYDSQGMPIRGQFSAEFENWCAINHKDPRAVAAKQLYGYLQDVLFLAEAEDARADGLFRRGLDSPNPGVVGYSVQGLGRLNDVSAIPLIAKTVEHLPAHDLGTLLMNLPWYTRPEAYQLMERLDPDPKARKFRMDEVERTRLFERQAIQARTGRAAPK